MSKTAFLNDRVALWAGDCREVLQGYESNSFDSVVTDPPYALVSIGKRFGKPGAAPAQHGKDGLYARASAGFMGKQWDTGETAFAAEFWGEVLRVLKPGGHVVAFSGTRTYHRMVCAIEDAGFEIRDQLAWVYGSGFPKSHNLDGDWEGWGTALKPAWEPIVLARNPLSGTVAGNALEYGTGALNIDGCRVDAEKPTGWGGKAAGGNTWNEVNSGLTKDGEARPVLGRWPANIIHDGSEEVAAAFPDGSARFFYSAKADANDRLGSKHPTVKRVDLMQWLCRLVTPPGGLVLDPFAGTGTTGEAAWREGFRAVLIEREAEYQADIVRRMELCLAGPEERRRSIIKRKPEPPKDGLLALMDGDEAA